MTVVFSQGFHYICQVVLFLLPYSSFCPLSVPDDGLDEPLLEASSELTGESSSFGGRSTEQTGQLDEAGGTPLATPINPQWDSMTDGQQSGWNDQPHCASVLETNDAKSERSSDMTEEGLPSPADPHAVVVPSFNLSIFHQRRMLSAEELQREKEEAMRAERKAKLQKDIIDCHRDLDQIAMTSTDGQKWGKLSGGGSFVWS